MAKQIPEIKPIELPEAVAHQALVVIGAVINEQKKDGSWHPATVCNMQFYLQVGGANAHEARQDFEAKMKEVKRIWDQENGQIGMLNLSEMTSKTPSSSMQDTTSSNAEDVEDPSVMPGSIEKPSQSDP